MVALPDNNTGRIWFAYNTGGGATAQDHEVMFRYNDGIVTNPATAADVFQNIFLALNGEAFFEGWRVTGCRYSDAGSNFSLPLTVPGALLAFVGTGDNSVAVAAQAREVKFVARSTTSGRKGSFSLYGISAALLTDNDFRVAAGGENWVQIALEVIEEAPDSLYVNIDNSVQTFYPYANWQNNSYWESRLRA